MTTEDDKLLGRIYNQCLCSLHTVSYNRMSELRGFRLVEVLSNSLPSVGAAMPMHIAPALETWLCCSPLDYIVTINRHGGILNTYHKSIMWLHSSRGYCQMVTCTGRPWKQPLLNARIKNWLIHAWGCCPDIDREVTPFTNVVSTLHASTMTC